MPTVNLASNVQHVSGCKRLLTDVTVVSPADAEFMHHVIHDVVLEQQANLFQNAAQ